MTSDIVFYYTCLCKMIHELIKYFKVTIYKHFSCEFCVTCNIRVYSEYIPEYYITFFYYPIFPRGIEYILLPPWNIFFDKGNKYAQ